MSTDRLNIGIALLKEAISIQNIRNNKAGPLNQIGKEDLEEVIKRVDQKLSPARMPPKQGEQVQRAAAKPNSEKAAQKEK